MNKYLVKTEPIKEQKEAFREITLEDIHTHNIHILTLSGNRRIITCKIPELQRVDLNRMAVEQDSNMSKIIRDALKSFLEKELSQEFTKQKGEKWRVKIEEEWRRE